MVTYYFDDSPDDEFVIPTDSLYYLDCEWGVKLLVDDAEVDLLFERISLFLFFVELKPGNVD